MSDSAAAVSYTHLDVYKRQVGIVRVVRGETFFDLYRAADCALYASKDNGKGCYSW